MIETMEAIRLLLKQCSETAEIAACTRPYAWERAECVRVGVILVRDPWSLPPGL